MTRTELIKKILIAAITGAMIGTILGSKNK